MEITIDGHSYSAWKIPFSKSTLLLIRAEAGVLSCGYLNVSVADKLGEALAVVRGVKDFSEMLSARVAEVSSAAAQAGVVPGMSGQDALLLMNRPSKKQS